MSMLPQQAPPQRPNLDFIMNPGQPPKKRLLPTGGSLLTRVVIIGGILVTLLIAFIIASNLLSAGEKEQKAAILKAAQQQTELARVAQLGTNGTATQTVKNLATTTNMTLTSDSKKYIATLAENGVRIDAKKLRLTQNAETDKSLEAAKAAANFDATFASILTEQLQEYQSSLKQIYDSSKNQDVKDMLDENYTNAGLLKKQAEALK